jgi:glucose-6-phosphate-specific signal transduction histidine kinase
VAVVLTAVFLGEVYLAERSVVGESFVATLERDEPIAIAAAAAFLLSLAVRTAYPLLPLGLAYVALVSLGQGTLDEVATLAVGVVLTAYSVGAWAGGRVGQVGALGVGGLAGLAVLRASDGLAEPRELAAPVLFIIGAWLLGLGARSFRVARDDERVVGQVDWEAEVAATESVGRDDTVRELRDVVERAMSAVILQARNTRRSLSDDPAAAQRSLGIIEAAGTEALEETQRLTGLLLSPDGAPSPEPQPGLADLDFLAEQVTAAGLPVAMRVEGRPLPLTPDLDSVAYRVVHQALMTTLEHATSANSSVVVRYAADELMIEVVDDGLGLEGDDAEQETAALMAVRKDVAELGGTLDAGPGDERGYWVLARFPYEPDWT